MTSDASEPTGGASTRRPSSHHEWTIITVTYNSEKVLRSFWDRRGTDDARWIVVDNASTDATTSTARELGADVIEMPGNLGFSAANNVGLAQATTRFVAFVNPDVRLGGTTLDALQSSLERADGLVAPQLLNADGSPQPNGRGYPTIWAKLSHRLLHQRADRSAYRVYAGAAEEVTVSWLMGAFVACRRETALAIGGWNASYFLYYEDSEIGLRAARHGIPSRVVGGSSAQHGWARETTTKSWRPWLYELRSASRFYATHMRLMLPRKWTPVRSPHA